LRAPLEDATLELSLARTWLENKMAADGRGRDSAGILIPVLFGWGRLHEWLYQWKRSGTSVQIGARISGGVDPIAPGLTAIADNDLNSGVGREVRLPDFTVSATRSSACLMAERRMEGHGRLIRLMQWGSSSMAEPAIANSRRRPLKILRDGNIHPLRSRPICDGGL